MDSLSGQTFAEIALSLTLLSFGEFGPALTHAHEALRIATAIEHQQWMASTSYGRGHIYLLLLEPAQALTVLEAGLSLAHALGSAWWITILAAHLGWGYVLKHDLPAAEATLQAVMPREQRPRNLGERYVAWMWGELMLAKGEPDIALQRAEYLLESVPGKVTGQLSQPIPRLLKLKGEALVTRARLDEARGTLEAAERGAPERHRSSCPMDDPAFAGARVPPSSARGGPA